MKLRRETRLPSRFRDEEITQPTRRRPTPSVASIIVIAPPPSPQPKAQDPEIKPSNRIMQAAANEPVFLDEDPWDEEEEFEIPEWPTPIIWDDLSDGMKLVLLSEVARVLNFRSALDLLVLDQERRAALIQICRHEAMLNHEETKRIEKANARQMELLSVGITDTESRNAVMEEEVYGKIVEPTTFSITAEQIGKAKRLLSSFNVREQFALLVRPLDEQRNQEMEVYNRQISNLPERAQIVWVQKQLDSYHGVGTCWYMLGLDAEVDWDVERKQVEENGDAVEAANAGISEQAPRRPRSYSQQPRATLLPNDKATDTKKKSQRNKNARRKIRQSHAEQESLKSGQARSPEAKHTPRIPSKLRNFIVVDQNTDDGSPAANGTSLPAGDALNGEGSSPVQLKRKRSSIGRNPFKQ